DEALRAAEDAGEDVIVTREVLRRAVHDEIDPEVRRADVHRGSEGRVDQRLQPAARLTDRREAREIDAREVRIGGGLAHDEARLRAKRFLEAIEIPRLE